MFVGYSDLNDPDQPGSLYTILTDGNEVDVAGVEIMATAFANLLADRALRPTGYTLTALIPLLFGFVPGAGVYLMPAWWSVPLLFAVEYVEDLVERQIDPKSVRKVAYEFVLPPTWQALVDCREEAAGRACSLHELIFDALSQPVKRQGVDITEFRADAIMCAWIAETNRGVRANAIRAAVDVVDAVRSFSNHNAPICLTPRNGLQDGEDYVGHTGDGGRMVYSIVGDTANTASRLESLNKHLETNVLAAASVVLGNDDFIQRFLGFFRFVGRADATPAVEVLARKSEPMPTNQLLLCERFGDRPWVGNGLFHNPLYKGFYGLNGGGKLTRCKHSFRWGSMMMPPSLPGTGLSGSLGSVSCGWRCWHSTLCGRSSRARTDQALTLERLERPLPAGWKEQRNLLSSNEVKLGACDTPPKPSTP